MAQNDCPDRSDTLVTYEELDLVRKQCATLKAIVLWLVLCWLGALTVVGVVVGTMHLDMLRACFDRIERIEKKIDIGPQ